MLVLSRKVQEQIRIGENITLTVLKTQGKTVRIGIEAPRHVRIVRGELPPPQSSSETNPPSRARQRELNRMLGNQPTFQPYGRGPNPVPRHHAD